MRLAVVDVDKLEQLAVPGNQWPVISRAGSMNYLTSGMAMEVVRIISETIKECKVDHPSLEAVYHLLDMPNGENNGPR